MTKQLALLTVKLTVTGSEKRFSFTWNVLYCKKPYTVLIWLFHWWKGQKFANLPIIITHSLTLVFVILLMIWFKQYLFILWRTCISNIYKYITWSKNKPIAYADHLLLLICATINTVPLANFIVNAPVIFNLSPLPMGLEILETKRDLSAVFWHLYPPRSTVEPQGFWFHAQTGHGNFTFTCQGFE